jgi:hypothetical protein
MKCYISKLFNRKPLEFIGTIFSVLNTVIAVVGIWFVVVQIGNLRDSLDSEAYNAVSTQLYDLDKVFVEKPNLRPYFEEGRKIDPSISDEMRNDILAYATLKLDFIEDYYAQ